LLRARDHGATVQRLMPAVHDLQHFSAAELLVEVRGAIEGLRNQANEARATQVAQGVSSPGELSQEARVLLRRAPLGEKAVKTD
jgi:hypothetical protein